MNATQRIAAADAALSQRRYVHCNWFGSDSDRMGFPCGIENEVGEFLYGLTAMIKPDRILETGTRSGISTRYMALALQDWHPEGRITTIEIDGYCQPLALSKFTSQGYNGIESILGSSLDYTPPPGTSFGLLWLDSEPNIRYAELQRFWPYLAAGGLACIHDMNQVDHPAFGGAPAFVVEGMRRGTIRAMSWPNDTGLTMFQKTEI